MSKDELIELLIYPRAFVTGQIAAQPCNHGRHYAESHSDCQHCWHSLGCEWLQHNDDCVDWHSHSEADLMAALESAMGQVDAHLLAQGHDRRSCHCDTCGWFRHAQRQYLLWLDEA